MSIAALGVPYTPEINKYLYYLHGMREFLYHHLVGI